VAVTDETSFPVIDPFALGSLEEARTAAMSRDSVAFIAPNGHPWEIAWCAVLAATLPAGAVCVLPPANSKISSIAIPDQPGIGIDWSIEPAFSAIRW
jgi:hypothetical protein